jgi:hypothetical protein
LAASPRVLDPLSCVLHESGWKEVPKLQEFQILPRNAQPIDSRQDKHTYWRAIAGGIQAATTLRQNRRRPGREAKAPGNA